MTAERHILHTGQAVAAAWESAPVRVVCPVCHGKLRQEADQIACEACNHNFDFCDGFPDLIVGDRFEDTTTAEKMLYEERCNRDTTLNYWIPLFRRIWGDRREATRLLSLGCGIGIDVDLLAEAGFECMGIDCGKRTDFWSRREHTERLLLANGMKLPFEDSGFDGVFCGCVFPHVGVIGDSFQVAPKYREIRQQLANEMVRVLRPGGRAIVSSPNRLFPFDLFHGRAEGSYRPRMNSPTSPFLLSHGDYRRLFQAAGCASSALQPVHKYWGFIRANNSWKGKIACAAPKAVFWMVSQPGLGFMRGSPINPWLVVLVQKPK